MASAAIKVVLVVMSVATVVISQDNTKYMDSPVYCGQEFRIGENQVVYVRPRSSVSSSNPPASCSITFTSAQSNTNYKFELTVEAVQITDCALNLNIYDGNGVGGAYLSRLGCSSTTSTGKLYPKSNAVTFHLTRTRYQYSIAGDFSIIVKLYYDKDGADNYIGTDSFPAGAIIGVILAIILLITAGVLLGWCYKTGRLPGMDPYSYPATKTSTQNLSTINTDTKDGESNNGGFVAWHNTEGKNVAKESKSNFDLDDSRVWESLTNVSGSKVSSSSEVISVKPPKPPPNWNSGRNNNTRNNDNNNRNGNSRGNEGNFQRSDANQLSNSPNSRIRGRNRGRGGDINDNNGPYNTINDNFTREGNDRGSGNSGSGLLKKGRQDGVFVNPDKEGYMYDYDHVKKLEGDKQGNSDPKNKTQDFGSELKEAVRRASLKRQKSENQTSDSDANNANKKNDESSDFASSTALNKTDGETTGPDAHSSPKVKKKKRKSSKERKSPKSGRKHKRGDGSAEGSPKKETSVDDDGEAPPEVYAPIFSGDEDNDVSRDYSHMYQPGYQGNRPPVPPYNNQGYPVGPYQPSMPGMYPPGYPQGVPYQQAGQAQWYMEAQPNGQQKMAFAMQTHSQSDDSLGGHHGPPNYTSTPYHRPQDASALVPAGTILDDPHIPQPGTSLMRYDEDPLSGAKTSQVVWTESKRDPTDPPPDSATQVTRKTITRITAKSTKEDLPDNPGPSLQDMSWRAAQQIQATGGQEPQFMSPTRGVYQPNAIQYANETPDRSNASYYVGPREPVRHKKTPPPVIHEDPTRSQAEKAFKDTITLNKESEVI
ncbi:myb-like protein P [Mya arenaria]|uniref:myb-like protein P n=1 Tax=Mya arenaria TaxID=6604 RepID=UPI0022E65531|nr:myb-like protein P [Mya arenaria]